MAVTKKERRERIQKQKKEQTPVVCFGCGRFEGVMMSPNNPERYSWKCSQCSKITTGPDRNHKKVVEDKKLYDEAVKTKDIEGKEHVCMDCELPRDACICAPCRHCNNIPLDCHCGIPRRRVQTKALRPRVRTFEEIEEEEERKREAALLATQATARRAITALKQNEEARREALRRSLSVPLGGKRKKIRQRKRKVPLDGWE